LTDALLTDLLTYLLWAVSFSQRLNRGQQLVGLYWILFRHCWTGDCFQNPGPTGRAPPPPPNDDDDLYEKANQARVSQILFKKSISL